MKRKDGNSALVSPPPTKRKIESTTTGKAVANFFTPASKKAPEPLSWRVVHDSLLVGRHKGSEPGPAAERRKIAAFDFDSTLIQTSSGNVFGKDATDWKWWDPSVPAKLKSLRADGFDIVIVSNQAGLSLSPDPRVAKAEQKKVSAFKEKVGHVLNQLDLPICILAATARDQYRKPRVGMWNELLEELDYDEGSGPDMESSIFVGDAAGRLASKGRKADHSSSDRDFAANVGISFKTPEECFRGEPPAEWKRVFDPVTFAQEQAPQAAAAYRAPTGVEIVLLCGSPGSGKSTFYFDVLRPLGYERINQDTLKSREKCFKAAEEAVAANKPAAVDNTNADRDTRAKWVKLAADLGVGIRCVVLDTPPEICRHNDTVRALNGGRFNPENRALLPTMAFNGFASRFKDPSPDEGFADVTRVPFAFRGDGAAKQTWARYWV